MTDAELIEQVRGAAEMIRSQASIYAGRADDSEVSEYLDEFARGLDDLMADCLTPAQKTLARNERLRAVDTRAGRRVPMDLGPAKSWE